MQRSPRERPGRKVDDINICDNLLNIVMINVPSFTLRIGEFDFAVAFECEEKVIIFITQVHYRVVVLAINSKVVLLHEEVNYAIRWQHS